MNDEFTFWGPQIVEHATFMHLGLEDDKLKRDALSMQQLLKDAFDRKNLEQFLNRLDSFMAFKREVLRRLNEGDWLGWLYPTFVDHILREETYFKAKLQGNLPIPDEAKTWLTFMMEHAQFAAQLTDPTEAEAIDTAMGEASKLGDCLHACQVSCTPQLIALSQQRGLELDQLLSSFSPGCPKSIIHPVLQQHVIREGRRFVETMQRILQGR